MPNNHDEEEKYKLKNYSSAEVEILMKLTTLEVEMKSLKDDALKYVRREEFEPIQKLVYGLVGVILLAFMGAVIALIIK